jgi:hypothetical protein
MARALRAVKTSGELVGKFMDAIRIVSAEVEDVDFPSAF